MEIAAEAWRGWRQAANGLTWRVALPSDLPEIQRIWAVKERLLGVKMALPNLFAPPVVLALVAEDTSGRLQDGVFLECVADVTKLSANPFGFESLTDIEGTLASFLLARGFRRVTAVMPRRVSEKMSDGLKRAHFQEQQLAFWDRELY